MMQIAMILSLVLAVFFGGIWLMACLPAATVVAVCQMTWAVAAVGSVATFAYGTKVFFLS